MPCISAVFRDASDKETLQETFQARPSPFPHTAQLGSQVSQPASLGKAFTTLSNSVSLQSSYSIVIFFFIFDLLPKQQ